MAIIEFNHVEQSYSNSDYSLGISSFNVERGETVCVDGRSGSGKTTFLHLLTGLIRPQSGQISVCDQSYSDLSEQQLDRFRADHFGVIFQLFNLIPYLTVLENIGLPCTFSNRRRQRVMASSSGIDARARQLCAALDLDDRMINQPVHALSVGQQQRVAIARALMGEPEIIVADEPTSALDPERALQFLQLLMAQCEQSGATLIWVSHDQRLAPHFNRVVQLDDLNRHVKGGK